MTHLLLRTPSMPAYLSHIAAWLNLKWFTHNELAKRALKTSHPLNENNPEIRRLPNCVPYDFTATLAPSMWLQVHMCFCRIGRRMAQFYGLFSIVIFGCRNIYAWPNLTHCLPGLPFERKHIHSAPLEKINGGEREAVGQEYLQVFN